MIRINKFLAAGIIGLSIVLASCSGSTDDINAKDAASAFINESDNIVAFGSANMDDLLTKADYKSVPKLGVVMGGEVDAFKELIDLDAPMYCALEGPFDEYGAPESAYTFVTVKDEAKLVSKLVSMGYDMDENAEIKVGQDEGFAVGVKGNLAIIIARDGDMDAEKAMKEAFKKIGGDVSGGKTDDILDSEGDIVFGVSLESLYASSNTDLNKLSKEKRKEIEEMVKDSYVQTSFKFDEGSATIETKNFFSKSMQDRMFFNTDKSASILKKLGRGEPRAGVATNIDMKKLQSFADDFVPGATDEIAEEMGMAGQLMLMSAGSDGFAGLFTGKMAALIFGDETMRMPFFTGFLGLTKNGGNIGNMAKEFLSYGDSEVILDDSGMAIYSNKEVAPGGKISLPNGCENFGKSGFNAFISFEGIDMDKMDLEDEQNLLRVIKYATFDYDNNGGRIFIKAKDGKENLLKQMMQAVVKQFADEIGGVSV